MIACMSSCTASVMVLVLRTRYADRALQGPQTGAHRDAAFEVGHQAPPEAGRFDRQRAGVYPGAGDRMADSRAGSDDHVVGDADVPGNTHHATDHATAPDRRAP